MMKTMGGSGALLSGGREAPVRYDLVEANGEGGVRAEGEVFGDAEALRAVYASGPCVLRLETGEPLRAFLEDCRSSAGVADIRVIDPVVWP
jgi:hypothetical protein